jgi:hypothetical protein
MNDDLDVRAIRRHLRSPEPAGFAGQRGLFELLVLAPVAVIVAAATAYCLATRHRNPAPSHREE